MKEKVIRTVLDEDVGKVLDSLGQLEAVQNGEIHCCEWEFQLVRKAFN